MFARTATGGGGLKSYSFPRYGLPSPLLPIRYDANSSCGESKEYFVSVKSLRMAAIQGDGQFKIHSDFPDSEPGLESQDNFQRPVRLQK